MEFCQRREIRASVAIGKIENPFVVDYMVIDPDSRRRALDSE